LKDITISATQFKYVMIFPDRRFDERKPPARLHSAALVASGVESLVELTEKTFPRGM